MPGRSSRKELSNPFGRRRHAHAVCMSCFGCQLRCPVASQGGGSRDDIAKEAILANPEAAAELFRDPKRLQRLLEENPALISVLKSRLGR
jgi:hypothetical protein